MTTWRPSSPDARAYARNTGSWSRGLASARSAVAPAVLLLAACLLPAAAAAASRGVPAAATAALQPLSAVERVDAPPVSLTTVQAEDAAREQEGLPPRFAIANAVSITPETDGTWESLDARTLVWRLVVDSPGALSLNLGFTQYRLPKGARLCVYEARNVSSALEFDARDNGAGGQLWTPVLLADAIVVEMTLPVEFRHDYRLELTSINVGYRFFGEKQPAEKAGSCNVDVICPEGDGWRQEIPAVGVYTVGGSWTCTGSLINNTAQDQTPYFLTAYHCGVTSGTAASVVVYWNFYSPVCGAQTGGSLAQFQAGAIFRSAYSTSDFTLIQLDDAVDPSFNLSYAGWERGSAAPTSAVAIHHPNCDEKSISFENDALQVATYLSSTTPGDGTHLRVIDWDLGTTEPGSSGSPLFDPNHHIVGQLHGGYAACENNESDWYGRLYTSWTGGGTSDTRLSNWLDPGSTGALHVNTLAPWASGLAVTPAGMQTCSGPVGGPFTPQPLTWTLHNAGTSSLAYAATEQCPWLSLSNASGTIAGGGDAIVSATIHPYATQLGGGNFTTPVAFTNLTDHDGDCVRGVRLIVGGTQVVYSQNMDANPGWATQGQWAWGTPTGGAGDHGAADPTAGHTGTRVYGYNLTGGYANSMAVAYSLTSTAINCSSIIGATLSFWRWLGVEQAAYDHASVQVSNNGSTWTTVWQNGSTVDDAAWVQVSYDISAVADGQSTVYLRWTMGTTDDSWTYCGWNIDDVTISGYLNSVTEAPAPAAAAVTALHAATPNPFNPLTRIRFDLARDGRVQLAIYDAAGRLVRRLLDAERPAGSHEVVWDGKGDGGRALASGVYFCRMDAGAFHGTQRLVMLK